LKVDFLYSGDLVRAFSSEAVALYQHLRPAQPHLGGLLQQVFGLCCNAVGLGNELLALRDHHRRRPPRRLAPFDQKTALMWKLQLAGVLLIVASGLSACASSQNPPGEPRGAVVAPDSSAAAQWPGEEGYSQRSADPLEPFNQAMFTFNRKADDWVLHPVAAKWAYIMPQPARVSVSRFFKNVGVLPRFANDLFQFQFKQGGTEITRFGINSTMGVAGLFDPADKWFGLKQEDNDFGLTLAKYDVGEGPYVVLPLLGPSTVRDALGGLVDGAMNPLNYVVSGALPYEAAAKAFAAINVRSENLGKFDDVDRYSIDLYGAVQDAYLQQRKQNENKVRAGLLPTPGSAGDD
jgi:phospholipid-binding lipoprotein MlaA